MKATGKQARAALVAVQDALRELRRPRWEGETWKQRNRRLSAERRVTDALGELDERDSAEAIVCLARAVEELVS